MKYVSLATAEYRHFRGAGHHAFGERPRDRADFLAVKARVLAKHAERIAPERLARAIATLREEQVQVAQAFGERRRAAADLAARLDTVQRDFADLGARHGALARERFEWEERFHAKNGEASALGAERESLRADVARLYNEESKLRAVIDDQSAHLARTYAEIERLNGVIRAMEQDGVLKTLAEPNLTAVSGQPAKFHAGGEYPYETCTGSGADRECTVTFRDFGVSLGFTPVVLSEGRINLKIETIAPDHLKDFDKIALVDVQPDYFPGLLPHADLVIDHHPEQSG